MPWVSSKDKRAPVNFDNLRRLLGRGIRTLAAEILWLRVKGHLERLLLPYLLGLDSVTGTVRLTPQAKLYLGKLRDYFVVGVLWQF